MTAMARAGNVVLVAASGSVLAPAMGVVALLVRFGLGRPVLFHQVRAGRNGAPFRLVKFRTMTEARDSMGRMLEDAERITPLGRFLRRTRLDELPELWNILRGDMAFVGPRPLMPATVAGFGEAGRRRGRVAPGLTGWAQVCGNTLLSDQDKLLLDLWYVDHRSWRLDAVIMFRTVLTVLFGERIDSRALTKARADARGHHRSG